MLAGAWLDEEPAGGVAGPDGEEAERSCALMTLAEKLAGGVSPSEDLETDGV